MIGLAARLGRLSRIDHASVGIRPQDRPYAPSASHFAAANRRLAQIEESVRTRYRALEARFTRLPVERALVHIALVERELDRARRAFGLFFEVFGQRGTNFAPALAGHDTVASDCYQAVRAAAPEIFTGPLLKPLCYMEHGYSPATMRRGVTLRRLLGESNPFPIIRIPWDREHPWDAVFLHEVAHNLQADLRLWEENRHALIRRLIGRSGDAITVRTYGRWHKEIFADLAAILLGGPAAAFGMAQFLAHPSPRTLTYRPGSAHPTAFLRVFMLVEMLRRLGFARPAARLERVWRTLYDPGRFHRLPPALLSGARSTMAEVVDEIAFQTRRNLAQRALVDVIPFTPAHEATIIAAARRMLDLVGFGGAGPVDFERVAYPHIQPDFDDSVVPSQLHAAAELYYIYQHERMRIFQVVDVLLRLFHEGTMRIQRGPGARGLYLFEKWQALRYSLRHRMLAYRRAFNYGNAQAPAGAIVNRGFHRQLIGFMVSLSQYFRDLLVGEVASSVNDLGDPRGSTVARAPGRCAAHGEQPATSACIRCGDFLCGLCSGGSAEAHCPACRARIQTRLAARGERLLQVLLVLCIAVPALQLWKARAALFHGLPASAATVIGVTTGGWLLRLRTTAPLICSASAAFFWAARAKSATADGCHGTTVAGLHGSRPIHAHHLRRAH